MGFYVLLKKTPMSRVCAAGVGGCCWGGVSALPTWELGQLQELGRNLSG